MKRTFYVNRNIPRTHFLPNQILCTSHHNQLAIIQHKTCPTNKIIHPCENLNLIRHNNVDILRLIFKKNSVIITW